MTEPYNLGYSFAFTFGDPEPVLRENFLYYLGSFLEIGGVYYKPPVDLIGLAKLTNANAYHGPIIHFKRNMLIKWFQPSSILSRAEMRYAALDYETFGNAYFQKFYDAFGNVTRLARRPALMMRRGVDPRRYVQLNVDHTWVTFEPDEILHIKEADVKQDIYGVPQYLGGIQSVLLSEDAALFRRKYYINGAHMGYILVTSDANLDEKTAEAIENAVKDSKGPGNFRSLYLNIPRSNNKEPVKIIPVGNIGSKDEFESIKAVTEMEMLAMHRVYPGLASIIPANVGGFGDLEKMMHVYHELEVTAKQQVFLEINEQIPGHPVTFTDPKWTTTPAA